MEKGLDNTRIDTLFERVSQIIEQAHTVVARTENSALELGKHRLPNSDNEFHEL